MTTPAGEVQSETRRLRVGKSKRRGFLRVSRRDPRQLAYDDGSSYFAVGENLSWYDARGTYAYDAWLGDDTHQPNPSLGTVEQGPFYAVQIVPGDVGTFGGAVTDSSARVLREDGSPIRGLYATGTTTAAVMGRTYPGAGCSIGPSFTWGFVAAKHAANLGNAGI